MVYVTAEQKELLSSQSGLTIFPIEHGDPPHLLLIHVDKNGRVRNTMVLKNVKKIDVQQDAETLAQTLKTKLEFLDGIETSVPIYQKCLFLAGLISNENLVVKSEDYSLLVNLLQLSEIYIPQKKEVVMFVPSKENLNPDELAKKSYIIFISSELYRQVKKDLPKHYLVDLDMKNVEGLTRTTFKPLAKIIKEASSLKTLESKILFYKNKIGFYSSLVEELKNKIGPPSAIEKLEEPDFKKRYAQKISSEDAHLVFYVIRHIPGYENKLISSQEKIKEFFGLGEP